MAAINQKNNNMTQIFSALHEVKALKEQTKIIRKRSYSRRKSKLDKYGGELITMSKQGASHAELQRWLKKKRISVDRSTVCRFIKKYAHG